MKQHDIHIDTKYFEPIREGQITLLIFDKKEISPDKGDYVEARKGGYSVKAVVEETYIKSFVEITEEEAKAAGFLNKDFLKDELIRRFKIDTLDQLLNTIDNYLFFLVKLDNKKQFHLKDMKINMSDEDFGDLFSKQSDIYETTSELYDIWRY